MPPLRGYGRPGRPRQIEVGPPVAGRPYLDQGSGRQEGRRVAGSHRKIMLLFVGGDERLSKTGPLCPAPAVPLRLDQQEALGNASSNDPRNRATPIYSRRAPSAKPGPEAPGLPTVRPHG